MSRTNHSRRRFLLNLSREQLQEALEARQDIQAVHYDKGTIRLSQQHPTDPRGHVHINDQVYFVDVPSNDPLELQRVLYALYLCELEGVS